MWLQIGRIAPKLGTQNHTLKLREEKEEEEKKTRKKKKKVCVEKEWLDGRLDFRLARLLCLG